MEERELGTTVRSIQGKDIKADSQPHRVTFADYVEKIVGEHYNQAQKDYLNKVFMTRETTLKPRRKDDKSETRAMLSMLAKDYEEFVFDTIKRRMEEQYTCKNTKQSEQCGIN